jgi:CheY-like chemotaxis protein
VLVNLVGNAIKFTEKGDILVLAAQVTRNRPDGGVQPFLQISVRDTGIGIAADKIARLFEAFTQADQSTTRKYGGTGLGLAISRKLCRLMGGEISLASQEGVGSNFFFEVPLRVAPEDNTSLAEEQQWLAAVAGRQVRVIASQETTAGLLAHYGALFGMQVDVRLLKYGTTVHSALESVPPIVIVDAGTHVRPEITQLAADVRRLGLDVVGLVPIGFEQIRQSLQDSAGPRAVLIHKPVGRRDLLKALAQAVSMPPESLTPAAPNIGALPLAAAPPVSPEASNAQDTPALPGFEVAAPIATAAPAASPFLGTEAPAPAGHASATIVPAPANEASATQSSQSPGPTTFATQHPARILLVEDQPMNQKLTKLMLNRLGYKEVDLAENGREAVDLVERRDYDVVLMDLQMPIMGGEDAAREIRGNLLLKHQPVIVAVTGYALSGVRESCYESGMNEFLTKPVSLENLRETLSRSLSTSGRA